LYGRGHRQQEIRFGPPHTPDVIKTLMLVNVACYLVQQLGGSFSSWFMAQPELFWKGWVWQAFTYMWLHGGLLHIAFNLFSLWMFGSPLASAWGQNRFLRFYLLSGLGAGLLIVGLAGFSHLIGLSPRVSGYYGATLGASGAVMGVLVAYTLTWPNRTIALMLPPVEIKAIWLVPVIFAMEFFTPGASNISHVGHLGGAASGWLLFRHSNRLPLLPSREQIRLRWRRYKMRRQLHEVKRDQQRSWRDDSRLH
jgi:membrane associated rhomboid family serine protease